MLSWPDPNLHMTLRMERDQGVDENQDSELSRRIAGEVKKQILVSCDAQLVKYGTLPRSERKSKRVFDNREK
jgi:phenylacetate-CoA ligase